MIERIKEDDALQFRHAPSGEELPDELVDVKFSGMSITHDNVGVFYSVRCFSEEKRVLFSPSALSERQQRWHEHGKRQLPQSVLSSPRHRAITRQAHRALRRQSYLFNVCDWVVG